MPRHRGKKKKGKVVMADRSEAASAATQKMTQSLDAMMGGLTGALGQPRKQSNKLELPNNGSTAG